MVCMFCILQRHSQQSHWLQLAHHDLHTCTLREFVTEGIVPNMLTKAFLPRVSPKNVECALRELVTEYTLCPRADGVLLQAKNYAIYKGNAGKLDKSTCFSTFCPKNLTVVYTILPFFDF